MIGAMALSPIGLEEKWSGASGHNWIMNKARGHDEMTPNEKSDSTQDKIRLCNRYYRQVNDCI